MCVKKREESRFFIFVLFGALKIIQKKCNLRGIKGGVGGEVCVH